MSKTTKYSPDQLPGELYIKDFFNNFEKQKQGIYHFYQNWRMNTGLSMNDIDFVMSDNSFNSFDSVRNIEYSKIDLTDDQSPEQDYAILEAKHFRTKDYIIQNYFKKPCASHRIADKAELPFFIVKYYPSHENHGIWQFHCYPINKIAQDFYKKLFNQENYQDGKAMSEKFYVKFLYKLHGKDFPQNINDYCGKKYNYV